MSPILGAQTKKDKQKQQRCFSLVGAKNNGTSFYSQHVYFHEICHGKKTVCFFCEKHLNQVTCYGDDSHLKQGVIFLPWRPSLLAGPRLLKLQEVPEGPEENVLVFQHDTVKPQHARKQMVFSDL